MQSIEGVNGQNKSQSDDPCVLPSRSRSGRRRLVCSRDPIAIAATGRMCSYSMGCLCLVSMLLGRYRSGRRRRSAVSYWTQPQVWSHQQPPPMTYTSAARFEEAKQMQMLSLVSLQSFCHFFVMAHDICRRFTHQHLATRLTTAQRCKCSKSCA